MINWVKRNKKLVAAIGVGVSAASAALGYEFSPQIKAFWAVLLGG